MTELKRILRKVYADDADKIYSSVREIIGESKLIEHAEPTLSQTQWHKHLNLYVTYPDAFADKNGKCDFYSLSRRLEHIKNLGCNAVHVLPFYDSPLIDKGFDVKDYFKVRPDLGGEAGLEEFLKEAGKQNLRVVMDLIVNHVSNQHEWVKKAQSGDEHYCKFFLTSKQEPKVLQKFERDNRQWVIYDIEGKEVEVQIYFPDQAGINPHWVLGKDGYWYFHTFYPQQLDVDWFNPEVFIEYVKVLKFWAEKGFSFRLDAVASVGKKLSKGEVVNTKFTHLLVSAMHFIAKSLNSEVVFLPENLANIEGLPIYAGTQAQPEAELLYNSELMANTWLAMAKADAQYIWRVLRKYPILPDWLQLVTYLRNHDNLNMEVLSREEQTYLSLWLLGDRGFTDTRSELSGRTASLLKGDAKRILMAYLLLCSLPGAPAIIYGDETGELNDINFAQLQWELKLVEDKETVDMEYRDIARGVVDPHELKLELAKQIYKGIAATLKTREKYKEIYTNKPNQIVSDNPHVFSARYDCRHGSLYVYINLSEAVQMIRLETGARNVVLKQGGVSLREGSLKLKPFAGAWLED